MIISFWNDKLTGISVRQIYLEVITLLFSYRPVYQARASIIARGVAEAWYKADVKTAMCINLLIIRSNLPIRQWINYFIYHNSLLEYAESNIDEWLIVCCGIYTALALAVTANQRRPSLPVTYGNFELSYTLSIEAVVVISATGISIYNGPLLMITARC